MRNPVTACLVLTDRVLNDAAPLVTDAGRSRRSSPAAPSPRRCSAPTSSAGR
jgi:hypothetical protein